MSSSCTGNYAESMTYFGNTSLCVSATVTSPFIVFNISYDPRGGIAMAFYWQHKITCTDYSLSLNCLHIAGLFMLQSLLSKIIHLDMKTVQYWSFTTSKFFKVIADFILLSVNGVCFIWYLQHAVHQLYDSASLSQRQLFHDSTKVFHVLRHHIDPF